MPKERLELSVGIFILTGIVILVVIVFSIGDIYIYKPGYHLRARFGFVYGLEIGAPVRLAGATVGRVEAVNVVREPEASKTLVEALLWINKNAPIEKDATFHINSLGLLGEKYVEISPGTPGSELLEDGNMAIGYDPVSVERLSEQMQEIARQATKTFGSINELIGDEALRNDLKASISESRALIGDMRKVSLSANEVLERIKNGEGTIGKLLKDDEVYNDIRAFVRDIKDNPWKLIHRPARERVKEKK